MPWSPSDAPRHNSLATTRELRETWASVANETLEETGDEGRAIREANAVIKRERRNQARRLAAKPEKGARPFFLR
jgi:hypothetical protein